jgi:anti-sigma B factor antagonist
MGFAVEQTSTGVGVCVAVAGEVDVETAPQLRHALESAVDAAAGAGRARVVVDLGAVTFMDSTGLTALVAGRARAMSVGVTVALLSVPDRVRKILSITGLLAVFPIENHPASPPPA